MVRNVLLSARFIGYPPSLNFTLDDETIELGGRDAEAVGDMLRAAATAGSVLIAPYPTAVAIDDPFRNRAQFAAVLAEAYALPDWLQAWALEGEDDSDEDGGDIVPGLVF